MRVVWQNEQPQLRKPAQLPRVGRSGYGKRNPQIERTRNKLCPQQSCDDHEATKLPQKLRAEQIAYNLCRGCASRRLSARPSEARDQPIYDWRPANRRQALAQSRNRLVSCRARRRRVNCLVIAASSARTKQEGIALHGNLPRA